MPHGKTMLQKLPAIFVLIFLKYILIITALSFIFISPVFSETGNVVAPSSDINMRDYLDEIAYYDLQMGAVSVDMYLYLGWAVDEKEEMRKAAAIAVERLDSIIKDVNGLNAPKGAADVKSGFISAAEYLKEFYRGVELKDDAALEKEFDIFKEKYAAYQANYKKIIFKKDRQDNIKKPDPDFPSKELNDDYIKALNFIEEMKYKEVRDALLSLRDKADKNSIAYDYVLWNLSAIAGIIGYDFEEAPPEDKSEVGYDAILKYSEEILNKGYSPLFVDFFERWMPVMQLLYGGVSNWSNIPNWEYNIKKKELINKIKVYLKDNPQDNWAENQVTQLLAIDNILRGGPMGNYTLNYIGMLYPLPEDKTSPAEDKKDIGGE